MCPGHSRGPPSDGPSATRRQESVPVSMMGSVGGEAVDDGRAEAGVGGRLGPAAEGLVADAVLLLAFGQDLEEELRAVAVELHIPELVDPEEVDAAVAVDHLGELLLVCGLDELVDQLSWGARI